ncbi:YheC/YheD family endospore coat-associated protein [Paenibacillus harenae]|uniref:YheC/YheD family endospore coat-associated protein n=1 Tax=Paenibacillus harenae TaxID=306543 RepID=UPI00278EFF28|nr:YheC/YheD family protein [Paenibacillus harenae]MDQ0061182.1 glutathione synthase/RimK-type ligase-like ATP-grasp enzyme [Paenibacillus harenae]
MLKSKVAVQVISSGMLPEDTLMLGEAQMKQLRIPQGQHITLRFGSFSRNVKAIPIAKFEGMRVSQSLAKKMGIDQNATLGVRYKEDTSSVVLGPLIGVLVSRDYPNMPDKPFGSISMFCRELAQACAEQGAYVYFFTPNQLGDMTSVSGWVFAGGWKKTSMPMPDVVNNRITSRKMESRPSVQHFLKEVKLQHTTVVFNEKFLDKAEVFDALKKDETVARYLPESHLLRNYTMLNAMCSRYNSVFLKPIRGSLGKGIIRITRAESNNGYLAMFATASGSRKQMFNTLEKLFSTISTKMKTIRYQIQQGLQLIEIQKRPVDFRALVQKNAKGKWAITSIVARTAGDQHFVSNLARGGTLSTAAEAIGKSNLQNGINKHEASVRLRQAALHIAKGVDAQIPAHFGELGIDLAMDTNGRVWLLEVNSKPSKNDNTPLNDNKIRPSVLALIQYSRFLSGF